MRALFVNSFYVLRDIIIYQITFLLFYLMWSFWQHFFPSQLDLSIVQASLLSYSSPPPIPVDMISRNVDKNALLIIYVGFHILQEEWES
jgi:multisubunit Na+/H+ antiporter MnhE subunit